MIFFYIFILVILFFLFSMAGFGASTFFVVIVGFLVLAFVVAGFMTGRGYSNIEFFSVRVENAARMIYDLSIKVPEYEYMCKIRDILKYHIDYNSVIADFRTQKRHPIIIKGDKNTKDAVKEFLKVLNEIKTRDGEIYFYGKTASYRDGIRRILKSRWEPEDPEKYIAVADEICALISADIEKMKKEYENFKGQS